LDELKTSLPKTAGPQMRAQCTLQVFEALNTRPPGWLATLGLAAVHGGSFVAALVLAAVFVLAQHGGLGRLGRLMQQTASTPKHVLDPASMQAWHGAGGTE